MRVVGICSLLVGRNLGIDRSRRMFGRLSISLLASCLQNYNTVFTGLDFEHCTRSAHPRFVGIRISDFITLFSSHSQCVFVLVKGLTWL